MASTANALPVGKRYEGGLVRWLTTTDHKDIGLQYIAAAILFFLLGGLEALLIRTQLAQPELRFLSPEVYNQMFTMHGTTMVFLFGMPILIGIANYMVPLMIGARDMAFPRLNAFSFWVFLFGGLLMYSAFLLGGAPDAGWFAYAPLNTNEYLKSPGMSFWALGIIITGVGSIAGAVNFMVTILNMRAPGMTLFKMPLFVWQVLVTSFLLLFAIPSLTVASILLFLDRHYGAPFFQVPAGSDPLLWQNLFWFFGHPEVYILILPGFGMISEVVPVFSRKPIFGYLAIAGSGIAIGVLGFLVWAHHMFAVGMTPVADAVFSLSSMIIAVPTSIKIFNWIATMWGGQVSFKTPMLFAIGFIAMFIMGGLTGVQVAIVPFDQQVTDTYFVVGHLHYVLFGGTVLAVFSGMYYWFPKWTGKMLSEILGKWHFWLMLIGLNLTFFPMHYLGMMGMVRRIWTYERGMGWGTLNLIETFGSYILGIGVLVFIVNILVSLRSGKTAGNDPWDAATLEWTTTSPPPKYNFTTIPTVRSARPFFDQKYPQQAVEERGQKALDADSDANVLDQGSERPPENPLSPDQQPVGAAGRRTAAVDARQEAARAGQTPAEPVAAAEAAPEIHLPGNSFNPILMAFGITLFAYGLMYTPILAIVGLAVTFAGIVLWNWEKR